MPAMRDAVPTPRPTCLRCQRALSACFCDVSTAQRTAAELVFLQHPRESQNPIGTARMAHLSVPGSRLRVGVEFGADPMVTALLDDSTRRSVILYPSLDARPAEELRHLSEPLRIFILDGTWWQAKKLWRRNPWMKALPAYRLSPSAPGQYRIRREPAAHCLSTIEAVAQLLDALEGQQGEHASLLRPFHAMVDKQIAHAQSADRIPRIRTRPRAPRICRELESLVELMPRLLIVHAEGNGWLAKRPGESAIEPMQWLAMRPATGETFHALLKTKTRAPEVLDWQGLTEAQLEGAISPAEFMSRWQDFTRQGDVWCTWGHLASSLFKQLDGTPAPQLNLHTICNSWLRSRMQHVENAVTALGLSTPKALFPGRGGYRLAQLEATVFALATMSPSTQGS